MFIECTDNEGFEDKLTPGERYRVVRRQGNSYFIQTDIGTFGWYGSVKFKVVE